MRSRAARFEGAALGPCLLSGLGAGALPTAVSVVSDIVDVGRNLISEARGRVPQRAFLGPIAVMQNERSTSDAEVFPDGIRTLKRMEVVDNVYRVVSLAEGVENLQFEYGLDDTGNDGQPLPHAIFRDRNRRKLGTARTASANSAVPKITVPRACLRLLRAG